MVGRWIMESIISSLRADASHFLCCTRLTLGSYADVLWLSHVTRVERGALRGNPKNICVEATSDSKFRTIFFTPGEKKFRVTSVLIRINMSLFLTIFLLDLSGAPNDGFLSDPLKRYFRLSGVPLKLCRFILGCAIIFLSVLSFKGNLSLFEITRASFVHFLKTIGLISFPKILADLFSVPETTFLLI